MLNTYQTTCPASSSNDTHTGHCSTSIVDSMAGKHGLAPNLLLRKCMLSPKPTRWCESWVFERSVWKPQLLTCKLPHMTQKYHAAPPPKVLIFIRFRQHPCDTLTKCPFASQSHRLYPKRKTSWCTNMATLQKTCWCNLSQQWKRKLTFSTTFGCDGTLFVPGMFPSPNIQG